MKILEQLFLNFLETSLTGTIFILTVLFIFKIFNKQINARIKHILCFLILLRILVPINPYIDISFAHILRSYDNVKETQEYNDREFKGMPYDNALKSNDILKSDEIEKNNNIYLENNLTNSDGVEEYNHSVNILYISTLIWSLGVVIVALVFNMSVIKFKIFSKSAEKINNNEIEQYMYSLIKNKNLKRNIPIYICNGMDSPCIIGMIKPKIYLPQYILKLDKETIRHVLLHEFMHYKRRDLYINFLSGILLAFHWFNPLVWILIGKMKIYRECACDLSVLEILGEDSSIDYGMTIINLSKIFFNKNNLNARLEFKGNNKIRERIEMIKRFKGGSYKITLATALGCMLVTTVLFTTGIKVNALNLDNEGKGNNQIDTEKVTQTNIDDKHEFLIDSDTKIYNDIDRLNNVFGENFKLPDFTLETLPKMKELIKIDDNKNAVKIFFYNKDYDISKDSFTLQIFNGDVLEGLTGVEKSTFNERIQLDKLSLDYQFNIEENFDKIDGLYGKCITTTIVDDDFERIRKYYSWNDGDLCYCIKYYQLTKINGEITDENSISLDNIKKIVESFKNLDELNNIDYKFNMKNQQKAGILRDIYDKEDLRYASDILGFNPNMPLQINGEPIEFAELSVTTDSNVDENNINYEMYNCYSYNENSILLFTQSRHDILNKYTNAKSKGYFYDNDKVSVESIKIDNKDILRYSKYYDNGNNSDLRDAGYMWENDGIYYSVTISNTDGYHDEIVKEFIDSNPIE